MTTLFRTLAAALLLLLVPAASHGQPADDDSAGEAPFPVQWRAGFRAGAFDLVNSADSYDAVYGDPLPLVGGQLEWLLRPRIFLSLAGSYGEVDGERVLPADPPIGTGIDTTLTYIPIHLTAAWRLDRPSDFESAGDWSFWLGAGPTALSWEDDSGFETSDGLDVGAHVALQARREGTRWIFGGELPLLDDPGRRGRRRPDPLLRRGRPGGRVAELPGAPAVLTEIRGRG